MSADRPSLISAQLGYWTEDFTEEKIYTSWSKAVWIRACRNRVPVALAIMCYALNLGDAVVATDGLAVLSALRLAVGAHSCISANLLFILRRPPARAVLAALTEVAKALEQDALTRPAVMAELQSKAQLAGNMTRFFHLYAVGVAGSAVWTLFQDTKSYALVRMAFHAFSLDRLTPYLLGFVSLPYSTGIFTYDHALAFLNATYICTSGLVTALGLEFRDTEARRSTAELRRLLRLHGALLRCSAQLDAALRDAYVHLLASMLLLPALCTAQLVLLGPSRVDWLTLAVLPAIGVFFVTLCLAAQAMGDASHGLARRCFHADWLREPPDARRLRCLAIALANNRPARVSVLGFGELCRPSCLESLRKWFSFLQVLINLS